MANLIKTEYEIVVGLEVHIQMNTSSKAFSRDHNHFGNEPNTNISSVTLAHPGTLPFANKAHLSKAIILGLATESTINRKCQFDRKNYFYPDLTKGYQITQDQFPIATGGQISFKCEGKMETVRIHHTHMEEDAGKSSHEQYANSSVVDYNRAGTPLLEMVTEPDLRSSQQVHDFMAHVQKLVKYLGISDGNMEEGSLRCDCNVSIRIKGSTEYGERCEIKNVNSKKFAQQAVEYEFFRQLKLLDNGEVIRKQTLNFNPETGRTTPIREKEDAHDYRYFPDPDLPPIIISEEYLSDIKARMPKLPEEYMTILTDKYGLSEYDADVLIQEKEYVDYFLDLAKEYKEYEGLAKLTINKLLPLAKEKDQLPGEDLVAKSLIFEFLDLIDSGKVSASSAYQILFPAMIKQPKDDLEKLADQLKILKSDDQSFVADLVLNVIESHPGEFKKYKNGNKGLIGFFMGQAMKKSQGKADPKVLKQEIIKQLNQ